MVSDCSPSDVHQGPRHPDRPAIAELVDRNRGTSAPQIRISRAAIAESVFLIHRLPAWGRSLRSRLNTGPKVHLVDSGLAARLLRLTPEKLARRRPADLTEFGHLLETFVVNECLKQASWIAEPVASGHFRTREGAEVDLVLERDDGGVVGIKVKASGGPPGAKDWAGLRALRDACGEAFIGGAIVYLGDRAYRTPEGFVVLPVDRLWQA